MAAGCGMSDGFHSRAVGPYTPPFRGGALDMGWTHPGYSGSRRTRAGIALAGGTESEDDLVVIDNWRSSHGLPLQTIKMMLKGRAKGVDPNAVIAQRLKRLPSIRAKLKRESMRLQQMQDLGGCRAIVSNMMTLNKLARKFEESTEKNPKRPDLKRHERVSKKDYIVDPKADGYRSVHYVFAYRTNTFHLKNFDGHLIEIQLRTRLQHAWATAVEIVDTFTGQSLKSALKTNIGDKDWRRFFTLASSAFAVREKTAPVPDTPETLKALKTELRRLTERTGVEQVLAGLNTAVSNINPRGKSAAAYVLKLNAKDRTVAIFSFAKESDAQLRLFREERASVDDPTIQVVQVSVERMQALKTAYPNYYLDTSVFLRSLRHAIH